MYATSLTIQFEAGLVKTVMVALDIPPRCRGVEGIPSNPNILAKLACCSALYR